MGFRKVIVVSPSMTKRRIDSEDVMHEMHEYTTGYLMEVER